MVYDITLKIKELGSIYGYFVKSTLNSIYLSNVVLGKSPSLIISRMKIEKKYVVMAERMAIPSFDSFTDEQLQRVTELNVPEYTQAAASILESRKKTTTEHKPTAAKPKSEPRRSAPQEKKEWDQFEANRNLFGVEPKFNVDEYACQIDRKAPEYVSMDLQAQKIAKELTYEGAHARKKGEATDDMLYSAVQQTEKWDEVEKGPSAADSGVQGKGGEPKGQADIMDKDIKQSYIDFQCEGWNAVTKLLNKKKAISSENEQSVSPLPAVQEQSPSADKAGHKGKKEADKSRAPQDAEADRTKKQRGTQSGKKQAHGEHKKGSSEAVTKFSSASEILEFITKNLKDSGHSEHKSGWSDARGAKEGIDTHLKPLETFEFPASKTEEIQKAGADKKFYVPKGFK